MNYINDYLCVNTYNNYHKYSYLNNYYKHQRMQSIVGLAMCGPTSMLWRYATCDDATQAALDADHVMVESKERGHRT